MDGWYDEHFHWARAGVETTGKEITRGINYSACSFMPTTYSFEAENYALVYRAFDSNTTTLLFARFMGQLLRLG